MNTKTGNRPAGTGVVPHPALVRQHLFDRMDEDAYEDLFRQMQPVAPVYWTRPGDPPRILHRAAFDDASHNFDLRADRILVKGRFQGGNVAYIFAEEWELFAALYRKPMTRMSETSDILLWILQREGPLTIQVMKEMTGWPVKRITPVLHAFQRAFVVFEDQVDNEWDRGWYLFEKEFPEVRLRRYTRQEALNLLLPRFLTLHVFATTEMAASYYRLPFREVQASLDRLVAAGEITPVHWDDREGYVCVGDRDALADGKSEAPFSSVIALQRNDFLVSSHRSWLESRFSGGNFAILYYLLIDGRFQGVVQGTFRHGANDLEDVALLPEVDAIVRREEILAAIDEITDGQASRLKRYCGKSIG